MSNVLSKEDQDKISEIIEQNKDIKGSLIPVLHEVQEFYGYLPYEAQVMIAEGLGIPLADVYGVATFYSRFTLAPVGKYKVGVCMGTACYVRNASKILEKVEGMLGIKGGETTEDGKFSIEPTRCIGACGLAPVMTINGDVYGKLVAGDVEGIIAKYY